MAEQWLLADKSEMSLRFEQMVAGRRADLARGRPQVERGEGRRADLLSLFDWSRSSRTRLHLRRMASTGAGEAPATSPSLTKVHIVSRSRSGSSSSLELDNTQSFYGIRRTTSQERHSRPTSPPVTPSQTTTSSNPRSPSAHSASILPAASFFNPKRATPLSSTARPLSPGATPASSDHSAAAAAHNWRFSTGPSLGSSGDSQEPQQHITQRRVGNGPLITRISAAVEYATPPSATTSFPPASSSAGRAGGRKYSSGDDMSDEDVEQDLASGGLSAARLARINRSGSQERGFGGSRTSLEQLGGGAGATAGSMGRQSFDVDDPASSVGHGQRDSSDFTFGAPPIVPTPQASRDHLVTSPEPITRLQQYPTGSPRMNDYPEGNGNGNKEGAIARARASISGSPRSSPREDQGAWSSSQGGAPRRTGGGVQLMDVETSGEYEREPQRSDAVPHPSTSAANLPKAQHTRVEIPTRPLVDAQGRKVRNYQLHEGSNRFYLRGRVLSSQDNPTPFVLSLALAVVMPILFFAFSGPFLWSHLGGGGKASIFIFVYMCLIMWSSMVSQSWLAACACALDSMPPPSFRRRTALTESEPLPRLLNPSPLAFTTNSARLRGETQALYHVLSTSRLSASGSTTCTARDKAGGGPSPSTCALVRESSQANVSLARALALHDGGVPKSES